MQCVQCKGCTEKGHARKDCPREASFCHPVILAVRPRGKAVIRRLFLEQKKGKGLSAWMSPGLALSLSVRMVT